MVILTDDVNQSIGSRRLALSMCRIRLSRPFEKVVFRTSRMMRGLKSWTKKVAKK